MANRYLDGLPMRVRCRSGALRVLVLWAVLVVVFLAIWQLLTPAPSGGEARTVEVPPPPDAPGALATLIGWGITLAPALALALVAIRFLRRRQSGFAGVREAEHLLARDDVARAVAALHRLLPRTQAGYGHFAAMLTLGRCAEAQGDFAEAREIFELSTSSLGGPGNGLLRRQLAPLAAAHCAFALAALGRLDEAERSLAQTVDPVAFPQTRARALRARALVLARRGEYKALLDLLPEERMLVRNGMNERDRTLLRVLAARAKTAIEGRTRSSARRVEASPALRAWIERVAPGMAPWGAS